MWVLWPRSRPQALIVALWMLTAKDPSVSANYFVGECVSGPQESCECSEPFEYNLLYKDSPL